MSNSSTTTSLNSLLETSNDSQTKEELNSTRSSIRSLLERLSKEQLVDLAKSTDALAKIAPKLGPLDDEELWHWIKDYLGIEVPRKKICPDHQAPFSFLADVYFERVTSAIAIANRGGSKTMISAIIHLLNSLFKPGCESAQV